MSMPVERGLVPRQHEEGTVNASDWTKLEAALSGENVSTDANMSVLQAIIILQLS